VGRGLPHISPLLELYLIFDAVVFGTNPAADSRALLKIIIGSDEDSFSAAELHEQTGWTRRRFNPVLALILSQIDERRVSQETGIDYMTNSFFLLPEDVVALKRFVNRLDG
jgi:hypothetical protein